ncbi:hypothetical protein FACS1894166_00140 [Bacilli bacterium]|nr:hypothetical protein FACS1894166_00140 [Bacilli bacterium]
MYKKINERTDLMIKQGWVDEVKSLPNITQLNALKAIGYVQILNSLINHTPINIDEIKQKTRNYAKRQIT